MSEVCSAAGLTGLAFLPDMLPDAFAGILISVTVYAVGCGLIEVLGSPIIEACPFENKEAAMSLLHSFYCWGSVGTIVISTIFFAVFGIDSWRWLAVIWALIPAYNIFNFATCPIVPIVEDGQGMGIRQLGKKPLFWVSICLMVCAGASELAMAGDLGGSIGPAVVGRVTQYAGDDIRVGMGVGLVFPIILIIMLIIMGRDPVMK